MKSKLIEYKNMNIVLLPKERHVICMGSDGTWDDNYYYDYYYNYNYYDYDYNYYNYYDYNYYNNYNNYNYYNYYYNYKADISNNPF